MESVSDANSISRVGKDDQAEILLHIASQHLSIRRGHSKSPVQLNHIVPYEILLSTLESEFGWRYLDSLIDRHERDFGTI